MRSASHSDTVESEKRSKGRTSAPPSAVRVTSSPNSLSKTAEKIQRVRRNIESVILGKPEAVRLTLVTLLARGHLLIEDVPGVGKTMLARALARSIDCEFRRVQFTPDLLPSDIVGVSVFDPKSSEFTFHAGPIFTNVMLADEINRTTPRTQSCLLEAMSDFQVSVDGQTHMLDQPFIVLATQNPIEHAGTYPLPEAQIDRFLMKIAIGYPDRAAELEVLKSQRTSHPIDALQPVITGPEVAGLQEAVRHIHVDDSLSEYVLALAERTRQSKALSLGVSTRGCLMLYRASQALAALDGREFITPDDVQGLVVPVWGHRIMEHAASGGPGRTGTAEILAEILDAVPVPV